MIRRIEALGYRSLRDVDEFVGPFEVLVGPNGSGKSSFLDVIAFMGDVVRSGPIRAILGDKRQGLPPRTTDARNLCWMRRGGRFDLAIVAEIPPRLFAHFPHAFAPFTSSPTTTPLP